MKLVKARFERTEFGKQMVETVSDQGGSPPGIPCQAPVSAHSSRSRTSPPSHRGKTFTDKPKVLSHNARTQKYNR